MLTLLLSQVRIVDCFLIEGQKVLFRVTLLLIRHFHKFLKSSKDNQSAIKKRGLRGAFVHFCKNITVDL